MATTTKRTVDQNKDPWWNGATFPAVSVTADVDGHKFDDYTRPTATVCTAICSMESTAIDSIPTSMSGSAASSNQSRSRLDAWSALKD